MKRNNGQTTLEYAVLIFCLVGALLAIQVYLKRSMQGRFRELGDYLGQQYSPKNTTGTSTISYQGTTETVSQTKSEKELSIERGEDVDLNQNGIPNEEDVFGSETIVTSAEPGTSYTQQADETVGAQEKSLFEK